MEEQRNHVIELLNERLETHDNNRREVQKKLHEICDGMKKQIDCFENNTNKEIEELFSKEDNRLQSSLNSFRENTSTNDDEIYKLIERAKAELLVMQSYDIIKCDPNKPNLDFTKIWKLKTERNFVPFKTADFEERKPINFTPSLTNKGTILLFFAFFNDEEIDILKSLDFSSNVVLIAWEKGKSEETAQIFTKEYNLEEQVWFTNPFSANTTYYMKMRIEYKSLSSEWSDKVEFSIPNINMYVWKNCPNDVNESKKYSVEENNPTIATKISGDDDDCTIIGDTSLPLNEVTSWNIKILKSEDNNGHGIYIGVAPFDINQNTDYNSESCGWYFGPFNSILLSGPPHNYKGKLYGPRKGMGEYVHTGDIVSVMMNTVKGELSFVVNRVNLGVAYEGIPLDKPLVPCVILKHEGDSVEFDPSEIKENVNDSILVPLNITTKSVKWDSITLTWDYVGGASFYQVEIDGSICGDILTKNTFTKRELISENEHNFRVRTVKKNAVSQWSDAMKIGLTSKPEFTSIIWRNCNDSFADKKINKNRTYSVDFDNPRFASIGDLSDNCTIVGNIPIPSNNVTSWSIKLIRTLNNDGKDIFVGVAPFDISQNNDANQNKCGWYFSCYDSTLHSGLPHKYSYKEYGPKKRVGKYVCTRSSVGVIMDTTKGELSFGLKGINLGVAYENIPLDKPLVPCVLLSLIRDSVEFCIGDNESCVIS